MVSTPFVMYWACGLILHIELAYLGKFGLFVLLYIYSSLMREFVFDERVFNVLPLSIYFAMKW
jgi:palmitoyltransferase